LTKNGVPFNADIELLSNNKKLVKNVNGELIASAEGTAEIIVKLKDYPEI